MAFSSTVVWERLNKKGKWCPYTGEVCQLLEQTYLKNLTSVCLGDADVNLKIYSVIFKDMIQVSEATGSKCIVRRRLCDEGSSIASAILWQWRGDQHYSWHCYNADTADIIEKSFQSGQEEVDLSNFFVNYPYKLCFLSMMQKNKKTKYHRPIRRIVSSPYPMLNVESGSSECTMSNSVTSGPSFNGEKPSQKKSLMKHVNHLWNKFIKSDSDSYSSSEDSPKSYGNKKQCTTHVPHFIDLDAEGYGNFPAVSNLYPCLSAEELSNQNSAVGYSNTDTASSEIKYATVNGKPWTSPWPPHTPQTQIKPVPGISPLHSETKGHSKKKGKKKKVSLAAPVDVDVMREFTLELIPEQSKDVDFEQTCSICFEPLSNGSSYDDDTTLVKLTLCSHIFHKSCIKAMYDSGPKDNYLQCPVCKTIHGIKCGIQPPGEMVYHVLPYSLPGYPDCETIRIIYEIHSGIQESQHPNPGKRYTVRGFPRNCYLPDNEMGRKILRLLIVAWQRRLIFTIGTSSTTGEEDTVTWNEIHHKTEFGYNRRGHGYPDPNYFLNIISELAVQGVTEASISSTR